MIIDGDDIYGDGVNIAARLEALAEPGGICISRMVRDQIRDKLPYPFEDMGEQSVKNIARPVRAYAMSAAAVAATPLVAVQAQPVPPRDGSVRTRGYRGERCCGDRHWDRGLVGVAAGGSPPYRFRRLRRRPTNPTALRLSGAAAVDCRSALCEPVERPGPGVFCRRITDDLTTDLSRISDSFVIARNTAFTYKGKAVDAKQIGRDLGVRYVVEGSVTARRRSGSGQRPADRRRKRRAFLGGPVRDRPPKPRESSERDHRPSRADVAFRDVEAAGRRIELEQPANPHARDFVMRGWAWFTPGLRLT